MRYNTIVISSDINTFFLCITTETCLKEMCLKDDSVVSIHKNGDEGKNHIAAKSLHTVSAVFKGA